MPSSYSNLLRLLKQATGENSNTWGDLVNSGFLELVEDSIAGTSQIDITAGTGGYSLVSNNGTTDESRCAILQFIGSPSVDKTITVPTTSKIYVVWNDLTTNKTLTMSTGSGNTTTLAQTKLDIIVVTEDGVASLLSGVLKNSNNLSDVSSASTARTNLGLGSASTLAHSTDGTLAANSDVIIATQKAVKTYADTKATSTQGANADTALTKINASKRILNHGYTTSSSLASTTTAIPFDNTIPQSSEGGLGMTADAFTPVSATSKLMIWYGAMMGSSSSSTTGLLCLFKDSDSGALNVTPARISNDGASYPHGYYEMTSGTTSAITFKLRFGAPSSTVYFNSLSGSALFGGTTPAFIKIVEVEA